MRIGIVSDIHCNIDGLRTGLDLLGEIDDLYCAGDAVFQYRWSNEVIELLKERDAKVVLGNHEETILGPDGERALARPNVRADLVAWLRSRPYRLETQVDGKKVVMTHGSPWEPWKDYHYPHEHIWARAGSLECDVLIVGHTHFQMAQRFGGVLVINPGSAGDPRDHRNNFQLSVAAWDTTTDEVTFYDYRDPTRNFVSHSGQM